MGFTFKVFGVQVFCPLVQSVETEVSLSYKRFRVLGGYFFCFLVQSVETEVSQPANKFGFQAGLNEQSKHG